MLHVRCGDDIVGKLREGGVPGDILVWADPVSQGPTPEGLTPPEWYATRSSFIARAYGGQAADIASHLRDADATLASGADHDEVVLWFEHDLFDQAILIRLLAWFAAHPDGMRLSIVSIGSHPEVRRFIGLGNLNARQLAELLPRRAPVTETMLAWGARAWAAFTAPSPEPLTLLADQSAPGLPFLASALQRHLRELPSTSHGLSLTQHFALQAIAAGAATPVAAFIAVQELEQAPWLGDGMFYAILGSLAAANVPLVEAGASWPEAGEQFGGTQISLTAMGWEVLTGTRDAIPLLGAERWVGGVRLNGERPAWRWDEATRRPVRG